MCEISHKIEQSEKLNLNKTPAEQEKFKAMKNIVLRHKISDERTKAIFESHIKELAIGKGLLIMDFKQNVTLGGGPRELGQSWYQRERRTIFGMALYLRDAGGNLSKWHFNIVSDCLTHDAIFVKMALSYLFASPLWASFRIDELSIWSDNAPHFKNKVLLSYFSELCQNKDFSHVAFCFFEAYHGKSEVDSMFGIMTTWMSEWIKTRYLNTTQDLLQCFMENNRFQPTPYQNFFVPLSLDQEIWTELTHKAMKGIKLKHYNFFTFFSNQDTFKAHRFAFKTNRTTSGFIEYSGLFTDTKNINIERLEKKKAPKYSKEIESVNSSGLTSLDEKFLLKKANAWGLRYKI
jgi:hypothetical protein